MDDDLDRMADELLAAAGADADGNDLESDDADGGGLGGEDLDGGAAAGDEPGGGGIAGLAGLFGDDPGGMDDLLAEPDFPDADAGDAASGADALAWRETYFVLFQRDHRPTLTQVEGAIMDAGGGLQIENLAADDDGLFQSVLIQAPEDNAALEISFEAGDAVVEQSTELAKMLGKQLEGDQLARLVRADARMDIMHFERVQEAGYDDDPDADSMAVEALDPATLITVVEALANLTDGLPIDPAAGELLT
ncbi:MAG: hypothetical protein AAF790_04875 [Planctomycetota bacterium]